MRYYHKHTPVFTQNTRYSCPILIKLEFPRHILFLNTQILNFMKIHPVGAELFITDTQTDMTRLTDDFRSFAKALSKGPPIRSYVFRFWGFETV